VQKKLQHHIDTDFPFLKGKKMLIAVSGGIDSVVLTHLLQTLNFKIGLAHCNFQLRNLERDKDEAFVKTLAQQLNIDFFTTHFKTETYAKKKGVSTQMAARDLRYAWFQEILSQTDFDYIATAHHADDSLETFLLNFTRGTGLEGLLGIPKQNNKIIRPLLPFSRNQIEVFAKKQHINWREDASNALEKYKRNKIRHQIVPTLKAMNPSLLNSFLKTVSHLQDSQSLVNDAVTNVKKEVLLKTDDGFKIDILKLKEYTNFKTYLFEILKPYNFSSWKDLYVLIDAQSGKYIESSTHRLVKNRDVLLLSIKNNKASFLISILEKDTQIVFPFGELRLEKNINTIENSKNTAYLDKDLLKFPLHVRIWQKGDYFYPLGMHGKKKLSKFLKDEKKSLLEKEKTWLLCNADNTIIWIGGKRQDNRFKVTDKTIHIIKITILDT